MKKPFAIIIISIFIFILSLPFTAVYTEPHNVDGLTCLLLGWAKMSGGGIAWMANPLLLTAAFLLLMKKPKASLVISFLAFALTLCFLAVKEITVDEAGHQNPITGYGPGYYLWIASCISMILGNTIFIRTAKQTHISQ
ncbi:hypothetical protein LXM63_09940 [Chryseobacterium gleum]|uniref:hypothetical protein n=1 Tax=Chryseobacterium gleum TaxID=250 RepID=UPI001E5A8305|nr:hypothetical protein [Chryseobacterium gleum]MCE4065418.1 hypothetical protein [Chryseobacterium gleum]